MKPHRILLLVLVFLTFISYSPALQNGFVWDDNQLVRSDIVTGKASALSAFKNDYWSLGEVWSDSGGYYRPLTTLSLRLDYLIGSGSPFIFHLTNIILHIISSVLLYFVARKFALTREAAMVASYLFALQPHHAELASWISSRPDLLMTVFLYAALITPRGSLVFGILALLSKETAVLWPVIAGLSEKKYLSKKRFIEISIVGIYLLVRSSILQDPFHLGKPDLYTAMHSLVILLGSWIYPTSTEPIWWPTLSNNAPIVTVIGIVFLIGLVITATIHRSSKRAVFAALLIHSPVALLMSSPFVTGMRPLYTASGFLIIALSSVIIPKIVEHFHGLPIKISGIIFSLLLIISAGITSYDRSKIWHDDLSFFEKASIISTKAPKLQTNLALAYFSSGMLKDSWEIVSRNDKGTRHEGIYLLRGQILEGLYCTKEAKQAYNTAITINPSFYPAYIALLSLLEETNDLKAITKLIDKAKTIKLVLNAKINKITNKAGENTKDTSCKMDQVSKLLSRRKILLENARRLVSTKPNIGLAFARAAATHGEDLETDVLLAQYLYFLNDLDGAIEYSQKALKVDRKLPVALKILGLSLIKSDIDKKQGGDLLRNYLKIRPESPDKEYLNAIIRNANKL